MSPPSSVWARVRALRSDSPVQPEASGTAAGLPVVRAAGPPPPPSDPSPEAHCSSARRRIPGARRGPNRTPSAPHLKLGRTPPGPRNLTSQAHGRPVAATADVAVAAAAALSRRPHRQPACPLPLACVRPRHAAHARLYTLRVSLAPPPTSAPPPPLPALPRACHVGPPPAGGVHAGTTGPLPARPGPAVGLPRAFRGSQRSSAPRGPNLRP